MNIRDKHPGRHTALNLKKYLLPAVIFLPVLCGFLYILLRGLGAYLVVADPLEKSDVIVVLSGGGDPRLEEAGRLYREELADRLILTETGSKLAGYDQDYSYNEKLTILDMDIPPTAILITEEHARDTFSEAVAVKDLMQKNFLKSAIVVTDPHHTRRARIVFRHVFSGSGIVVHIRPVADHWYRSGAWFLKPSGWLATFSEYFRLLMVPFGIMTRT